MIDLQWWQAVAALLGLLGLSGAPWITALLRGNLLTRTNHNEIVTKLEAAHSLAIENIQTAHALLITQKDAEVKRMEERHAGTVGRLVEEKAYERTRADRNEQRADVAIAKTSELATEFGTSLVKLLRDLPDGGGGDVPGHS